MEFSWLKSSILKRLRGSKVLAYAWQWVQNHDPKKSLLSRGQGVGTARPELPDALYGRAGLSGDFPGLPWI